MVSVQLKRAQPGQVVVVLLVVQRNVSVHQREAGVEARIGVDWKDVLAEAEPREAVLGARRGTCRLPIRSHRYVPTFIVEESLRIGGTTRFVGDRVAGRRSDDCQRSSKLRVLARGATPTRYQGGTPEGALRRCGRVLLRLTRTLCSPGYRSVRESRLPALPLARASRRLSHECRCPAKRIRYRDAALRTTSPSELQGLGSKFHLAAKAARLCGPDGLVVAGGSHGGYHTIWWPLGGASLAFLRSSPPELPRPPRRPARSRARSWMARASRSTRLPSPSSSRAASAWKREVKTNKRGRVHPRGPGTRPVPREQRSRRGRGSGQVGLGTAPEMSLRPKPPATGMSNVLRKAASSGDMPVAAGFSVRLISGAVPRPTWT